MYVHAHLFAQINEKINKLKAAILKLKMATKIQVGPDLKMFSILFATYTPKMVLLSQSERNLFLPAVLPIPTEIGIATSKAVRIGSGIEINFVYDLY